MKSPDEAHFVKWQQNPEPNRNSLDSKTILETEAVSDGYLWQAHNCQEGWLSFDGELSEIKR